MNTHRVIWFVTLVFFFVGLTVPASADVINISFKPSVKYNSCNSASDKKRHCYAPKKIGKFKHPKMGGLRVDACVYGTGWSNSERCNSSRLDVIGNDFCKSKGYKKSILVAKGSHKGKHAILTYKKGRSNNSYWKRKEGHTVIDSIYCQ